MADPPPEPPTEPTPFVAGLPDAPLERPSDFPEYDGPLVCPFYRPDHRSASTTASIDPYNERLAEFAFGYDTFQQVRWYQQRHVFRGDWWQLAYVRWAIRCVSKLDPDATDPTRFKPWSRDLARLFFINTWIHLEGANLRQLDLRHFQCDALHLEGAFLEGTRFDHAFLPASRFQTAWCRFTSFREAHCPHSDFTRSTLKNADFCNARLRGSSFDRARLMRADLDGADLSECTGVLFNLNRADRTILLQNAADPWSLLRRTYTGPMYIAHLLLLIAFLLPFAFKIASLSVTAEAYEVARAVIELPDAPEAAHAVVDGFDERYTQRPAALVLLGWTEGWLFFGLTIIMICYNGLRAVLTYRVSALRDAEERSRVTPSLESYYGLYHPNSNGLWGMTPLLDSFRLLWIWLRRKPGNPFGVFGLYRLHLAARALLAIALVAFLIQTIHWLVTTWVPVPK